MILLDWVDGYDERELDEHGFLHPFHLEPRIWTQTQLCVDTAAQIAGSQGK